MGHDEKDVSKIESSTYYTTTRVVKFASARSTPVYVLASPPFHPNRAHRIYHEIYITI